MRLLKGRWYLGFETKKGFYLKMDTIMREYRYFGFATYDKELSCTKWTKSLGLWYFHIECGRLIKEWL